MRSARIPATVGALTLLTTALACGAEVPWLAQVQQPPAAAPQTQLSSLWNDEPAGDLNAWKTRRETLRADWLKWLGPMPARPAGATWTVLRTDALPDVTRLLMEYEGEPGQMVQAYLLRPNTRAEDRSRPGVVALHPTTARTIEPIAGVEGPADQHTALALARSGCVVICPRCFLWQDAPDYDAAVARHRQRHPQTLGMHKMLYDAQRAVDLLAAQSDVDPQRLGAYGHSLGAKETLYLAAFDERIRAAVASEGGIEFTSTNWDAPWYLGPQVRDPQQPRNHHELIALIAPRAFLVMGGETGPGAADGDRSWPYIAAAMPIYRLYGEPARVGLLNHHEGHRLSPASMEKLSTWLHTYLP
ncbi:MAG: dienelactone hydrolase family protein [Planctomycetaceae bacterium]|nr:dienelactone hydrolase family protein [Planctomycetaceae bacterium]